MGRHQRAERRHVGSAGADYQVLLSLLTNRTKRHRRRQFIVQGVQPVSRAFDHGWPVDALVVPAGARLSDWARSKVETHEGLVYELEPGLYRELAEKDEPADLLAVCAIPERRLADVRLGDESVVVVLDRPSRPGNLGTIVRTADALGAAAVVVTGHATDPYDPAAVRASTGSIFAVPVIGVGSVADVADWVAGARPGVRVVGTDERGEALDAVDLRPPVVLLFGTEARGLSRAARDLCDAVAAIPMTGSASSLNVATAVGIVLYEVARRLRPARG